MTGHAMSKSFVTNMMMSVRAEENKSVHRSYQSETHNEENHRNKTEAVALPSVASYHYHDLPNQNVKPADLLNNSLQSEILVDTLVTEDPLIIKDSLEPELYNEAVNSISTDEERRAETLHVNKAAIDVSRRLDVLAITNSNSADKYARKCSNLIAMAELLASEARHKAAAILKAEKENKWIIKRKSNLPEMLSRIIKSRGEKNAQKQESWNHSHYSSYLSNGESQTRNSETAPAVIQSGLFNSCSPISVFFKIIYGLAPRAKTVRMMEESEFFPDEQGSSMLSLGSASVGQKLNSESSMHPTKNMPVGIMKKGTSKQNLPHSAPASTKRISKGKKSTRNQDTATAQKQALLKFPKFSKNSFSSDLDPQYGTTNREWASSFQEASETS